MSILTNTSAMVAIQTLKGINKNLAMVQSEISTGKKVSNARDNAAIFAISTVMQSDVGGFKAISESLSLGSSTVGLARNAAESVTGLLQEMKAKIVAAQENNVDRSKIQTDVSALRDQVASVVNAAQFNGLNLLQGGGTVDVLASLNRSSAGAVTASAISVAKNDLQATGGVFGTVGALSITSLSATSAGTTRAETLTYATSATALADTQSAIVTVGGVNITFTNSTGGALDQDAVALGVANAITGQGLAGITGSAVGGVVSIINTSSTVDYTLASSGDNAGTLSATSVTNISETLTLAASAVNEGDSFRFTVGGTDFDYIALAGDNLNDVAIGLKANIDAGGIAGVTTTVTTATDPTATNVTLSIASSTVASTLAVIDNSGGSAQGGLFALSTIDVSSKSGATGALAAIESLINIAIDAASSFGSSQKRIDIQNDFVGKLVDSMKTGIGSLVDADLEESSARLQALQVQQQLTIQALSIANQAPQNILALFR